MGEHGSETEERTPGSRDGRTPGSPDEPMPGDLDERAEGPAERAVRARSFGAIARAYADHRPGYPDAAIDWVLEVVSGESRQDVTRHSRVLDLGAGTGKLTAALVTRPGIEVSAVEPDPEMLAELRVQVPGATALAGTAEHIPLPDETVDAVLVGQAFHWFDHVPALTEMARVLRPGGVLGVLANREDDQVEWVAGYRDVTAWARMAGSDRKVAPIPEHPAFAPMERIDVANPERITAEQLIARLGTYSWISTLPEARRRAVVERSRAYLAGRPELAVAPGTTFELPLVTAVARLVRLDGRR